MVLAGLFLEGLVSPREHLLQLPKRFGGFDVVDARLLAAAHARNLRVQVWTVNDPVTMAELVTLGVHGVITDYPDLGLAALVGCSTAVP